MHEFHADMDHAMCNIETRSIPVVRLTQHMHEFHADMDHAMCNIETRSIPVVRLTQLRKTIKELSKNVTGTGVSQKLTVMPSASEQSGSMTMEVPG
jgi:hypothetical protein